MAEYNATLRFLYDLQLFGIKAGLQNIKALLRYLGHPEKQFPSIHIAGTNGKGSTASMIASMLTASGYRTGLYTSPHLVNFSERIRIDGIKIPEDNIDYYTKLLKPMVEKHHATFFEATTAMAFQYFADNKVDIAVIETGLGGRWDATNVITPQLSIVTNIGIEHTEYLGNTYSRIAYEKGGIIKPFITSITGTTNREALKTLKSVAKSKRSEILLVDNLSSVCVKESSLGGLTIDLLTEQNWYSNLFVSLAGEYQTNNLRIAVIAIECLKDKGYKKINKKSIRKGLAAIEKYSGLKGRIYLASESPLIIADVAHNPDGIKTLVASIRKLIVGKIVVVFGVMRDKDYRMMINILKPLTRLAIAVHPGTNRALDVKTIVSEFHSRSIKSINGNTVHGGIKMAITEKSSSEAVLLTGSHYVVGEALNYLNINV